MPAYSRLLLPWDSQPQDVAEICRDYAPAFVWNPGIGLLVPALGDPLTLTGTGVSGAGIHGRAIDLSSGAYLARTNYAPITTSNGIWTGDFTAFCVANPPAAAALRGLISQRTGSGYYQQFNIIANCNTSYIAASGKVLFSTYDASDTSVEASGVTDGKYHIFGIRRIGTTVTGWVDGVQVATVVGTVRAIGAGSAGLGIGCIAPNLFHADAVSIAFAAGFNTGIVDMADVSRNIWRATFAPRSIWIPVSAGGGGVSGTLATTNANDTSSAAGATTIVGTLAATNANDTSAASGTTTILGTVAATNGDDTAAASGTVGSSGSTGTVAYTNANDTAAATGTTTVIGTVAKSNADDSVSASGWVGAITGTLAITNANDTAQASGVSETGFLPSTGGWGLARRRKPREEHKPVLPPEVVEAVAAVPKARRKLVLADIIGKRQAAQITSVDLSEAIAASKKRKRQQEDELLLLM